MNGDDMTRTISKSMSGILEDMELENKQYVTLEEIAQLAESRGILTRAAQIANRLKQAGWLLPTSQRGVWEFAPASMAGPYSKNDPLKEVKAYQLANPQVQCFICLQTAAWAMGLADRVPSRKELAFVSLPKRKMADCILPYKYTPTLEPKSVRGVPCLTPESIVVHLASKPDAIKSWESVLEWLPDVVYEINLKDLMTEISNKSDSVKRRVGYLLQGMYPEASHEIMEIVGSPTSKIRFGPRKTSIRNDQDWMISDTILPFSVKELEKVK